MTSWPWSRIRPAVGSSKPAIIRNVVVLPEPDGPSIEKNSPSRTSRSRPATAMTSPQRFTTPSSRTAAGGGGLGRIGHGPVGRIVERDLETGWVDAGTVPVTGRPDAAASSRAVSRRSACASRAVRLARDRHARPGSSARRRVGARSSPAWPSFPVTQPRGPRRPRRPRRRARARRLRRGAAPATPPVVPGRQAHRARSTSSPGLRSSLPTVDLVPGETVLLHVVNGGLEVHEAVIGDSSIQDAWEAAEAAARAPPGPTPT